MPKATTNKKPATKKKKTTAPKKKAGAPCKLDKIPEHQLAFLYRQGCTDKQVAEFFGTTEQTVNNWKKSRPAFFESLTDWKKQADKDVERSLYERACGYTHPETKAQWVSGKDGGRWEYAEMDRHYPPDPTSMVFWLKNRQPGKWRDKQDHNLTGALKVILTSDDADAL